MLDSGSRTLWGCTLVLWVSACSFSTDIRVADAPPIDAIDAPPTAVLHWLMVSQSDGPLAKVTVLPIQDLEFETACPTQPVPDMLPLRDLRAHPNLPYVYAVEAGFWGAPITCNTLTWIGTQNVTTPRPIQRIVYDSTKGVGFFTGDGINAVGVYRFTTAANGTPTLLGSADATSESGPLALDATAGELFVVGPSVVSSYALVGAGLDLPTTRTNQSTCAGPADLIVSGSNLLSFCTDVPDIHRFTRNPFAPTADAGTMGVVDRVIPLPNDRAIAARAVPDLAVINLNNGAPTWTPGPTLGSRITAITSSTDGKLVVTARLANTTTAEVVLWRVEGDTITALDTTTVPGVVTSMALALRAP